ncbi:MAG TPA: LytR C-terminal domain-containing protein [Longimicrobiales bacterium]|nr:LytR C-terminal domain-containing protein [Longimicrobiales bacterium]
MLNASGRTGLARAATDRLRGGGFDVVYFGNASGFSGDSTLILDRTGDDAVAHAVARFLGAGIVRTERDTTRFVDATVIIGRDWR